MAVDLVSLVFLSLPLLDFADPDLLFFFFIYFLFFYFFLSLTPFLSRSGSNNFQRSQIGQRNRGGLGAALALGTTNKIG